MLTPDRVTSRVRLRPLLLVAVLVAAVAATGYVRSVGTDDADELSMPPNLQAEEVQLGDDRSSAPLTAPAPDPVPPAGVAASASLPGPAEAAAEGTRPADPATMSASAPTRLRIPSIGVDSGLVDLGLQGDGTLEVPDEGFPAGWYTGSPTPGELGPAIITGHVDWAGQTGVFFDLRDLAAGEEITITRQDGTTATFRVTEVERFDKEAFPTQAVYGDLDHAGLRLITCGGAFDRQARSYEDNIVIFAELTGDDGTG